MNYDPELAALLSQPWSNNACRGYVIYAMENCGFSPQDIRRVVAELYEVFDIRGLEEAQLAAVLCGQTTHLQETYADGSASCRARANVTVQNGTVQLHLREVELRSLYGGEGDLEALLCQSLQRAFGALNYRMQAAGADPFHLCFWQACSYGPGTVPERITLEVTFE